VPSPNEPRLDQLLPAFARAFPTQLVPPTDDYDAEQLFVGLDPDGQGRPRRLELTFLLAALDADAYYLQYFILLPFSARAADLARITALVNVKLPFGHFGMNEPTGWVYYRTVVPVAGAPLDVELALNTAWMCFYLVDQIADLIESVADGSRSLADAAAAYDELVAAESSGG